MLISNKNNYALTAIIDYEDLKSLLIAVFIGMAVVVKQVVVSKMALKKR
jgi:hypothetical protein